MAVGNFWVQVCCYKGRGVRAVRGGAVGAGAGSRRLAVGRASGRAGQGVYLSPVMLSAAFGVVVLCFDDRHASCSTSLLWCKCASCLCQLVPLSLPDLPPLPTVLPSCPRIHICCVPLLTRGSHTFCGSPLPQCRSAFAHMHTSIGRSDDIRLFRMCHMVAPILIKCIGPVPFFVLAALLSGGKTQQVRASQLVSVRAGAVSVRGPRWGRRTTSNAVLRCATPCSHPMQPGERGYKGVPRTENPVVCPMFLLANYFFMRFTFTSEPFPDCCDKTVW